MKYLLITLFTICGLSVYGQFTIVQDNTSDWVLFSDTEEHNTKTRVDTAYGMIVWVNYGEIQVDFGFVSDTVVSYYTTVSCPDPSYSWGCAVLHYGWVDKSKSSTFHIPNFTNDLDLLYRQIPEKLIIKFIPNE